MQTFYVHFLCDAFLSVGVCEMKERGRRGGDTMSWLGEGLQEVVWERKG